MKLNRLELMDKLGASSAGLTSFETLEQSNTFVFKEGKVITFNGEIKAVSKLEVGFDAAVHGNDLKKILNSWDGDEVSMELKEGKLSLRCASRSATIPVLEEVLLPYDEVPAPSKMAEVDPELFNYIHMAARLCGVDHSSPRLTHVHVTPDLVEATDGFRLYRARLKTGMTETVISAEAVIALHGKEVLKAESADGWLHVRTKDGVTASLRCGAFGYFSEKELSNLENFEGVEVKLPLSLSQVLERVSNLGGGSKEEARAQVTFEENMIRVKILLEGGGFYAEKEEFKYSGEPFTRIIPLDLGNQGRRSRTPDLLRDALSLTRKALIGVQRLKIEKNNVCFVFCLGEDQ